MWRLLFFSWYIHGKLFYKQLENLIMPFSPNINKMNNNNNNCNIRYLYEPFFFIHNVNREIYCTRNECS